MTAEVRKAHLVILCQLVTVQRAVVIAQTAVKCPPVNRFANSGEQPDVKQTVVRNEIFLPLVEGLLVHTTQTCRQLPAVLFVGQVTQVVGQRVQFEVQIVVVV